MSNLTRRQVLKSTNIHIVRISMHVEVVTVNFPLRASYTPTVTRIDKARATSVCMPVAINPIANQVISTPMQKLTTHR